MSIVADPAYDAATVSVRSFATQSFARQFDADIGEVERDFQNGELRRYFADDRDPVVIDMAPTPLEVAQRSHNGDLDLRRRRLESHAKKIQMDTGHHPDELQGTELDLYYRRLELHRKKIEMDAAESRSMTGRGEPWDTPLRWLP